MVLLILALSAGAFAQLPEVGSLAILSPLPNSNLSGRDKIIIRWVSFLGDTASYQVVYSSDGKTFDKLLGSTRGTCELEWDASKVNGLFGWVKVKAYDGSAGMVSESVVPVTFVPRTVVIVSKANQKVFYIRDGKLLDVFTCSTALPKYDLSPGHYRVYSRQVKHWSKEYEVWMPHSLFFHEGYALHATTMIRQLGRPASHGCVRLHPKDAEALYHQVGVGTPVIVYPRSRDCSGLLKLRERPSEKKTSVAKG
jgi:hypothetical protein